jgi:2-methylcitrate dehydratase PrpD
VVERGRIHILDALGLALSGARAHAVAILRDHVVAIGGAGDAAILGTGDRAAPRFAALVNGTAMHADNFDDTNPQADPVRNGGIHATAAVLPAALAVAEVVGASGRDLTVAFHIGVEIACRLKHASDARHYADGFDATATLTPFGCAAAAGRLAGLDAARIAHALALAASQAAGVRRNFGTMVEEMHTGLAAETGVVAADLAGRGLEGAADALEGRFGFLHAAAGGYDANVFQLGAPWAFVDPGTWIKPHPSGALTHPAMTLLFDLMREHDLGPSRVARIGVRTNARVLNTLIHHRPRNALEAKFSMEYALAAVLITGRAGLGDFTDQAVARDDMQGMIARIDYSAYDDPAPDYTNVTTLLDIELVDGRHIAGRADFARGSSGAPMRFADVAEKFLGCADYAGWPADRARAAVAAVARLDALDDVRDLTRLLAG